MAWPLFMLLVSRIPAMNARRLLEIMDGTLYGAGKPHAEQGSQHYFDVFRKQVERVAFGRNGVKLDA
jgi:hypothetical protein